MTDFEIELFDFDTAVDRLRNAGSNADAARQAIRAALDHLYSLELQLNLRHGYWDRVEESEAGQMCSGLTFIRGRAVHHLVRAHEWSVLVPGPSTFPSSDVAPGANWEWQDWGR